MLHKYSEVLNLPVICADDGMKAGVVKDILFSLQDKEVKGFLLAHNGLSTDKRVLLPDEVKSLGSDAAVISSPECIRKIDRSAYSEAFPDEGRLIGIKVFSKDGEELGIVKDVIFDFRSKKVEGFIISDGLLQDILEGRKLLPLFGKVEFGEELIVVDNEAVDEIEISGGGIKNRLLD